VNRIIQEYIKERLELINRPTRGCSGLANAPAEKG
jgi:hypothetical protein